MYQYTIIICYKIKYFFLLSCSFTYRFVDVLVAGVSTGQELSVRAHVVNTRILLNSGDTRRRSYLVGSCSITQPFKHTQLQETLKIFLNIFLAFSEFCLFIYILEKISSSTYASLV